MSEPIVFIAGKGVYLRPLERNDANNSYLRWLNDPEVLRYRGRKSFPTTQAALESYIDGISTTSELVLAICVVKTDQHIGNIALNTILWTHRSAELSIMIGDKSSWGHGYGGEAVRLLTHHAFVTMGLRRIWAESPNPGFNAIIAQQGWFEEGRKREAFLLDGDFVDILCYARLADAYLTDASTT